MKLYSRTTAVLLTGLALLSLSGLRCSSATVARTGHPAISQESEKPSAPVQQVVEKAAPEGEQASVTTDFGYEVIHIYPHDPDAFTQGLVIDEGNLYEGTGLLGHSTLRQVTLETGALLRQHKLPENEFGEGIAVLGNKIFQLTWQSKKGYVYDKKTFELLREFSYETEGWGLTQNGSRLIMSDGTSRLFFLDPESLTVVGELPVWDANGPVTQLNELEWVNGEIFANIWKTEYVVRIDPDTGQVRGRVHLQGLLTQQDRQYNPDVLNGIAYDKPNDRFFITGKHWPKLFEIRLVPMK